LAAHQHKKRAVGFEFIHRRVSIFSVGDDRLAIKRNLESFQGHVTVVACQMAFLAEECMRTAGGVADRFLLQCSGVPVGTVVGISIIK